MNFSAIYRRLLPRNDKFSRLFLKHMELVRDAAELFESRCAPGADDQAIRQGIHEKERAADAIVRQVSDEIRRTLFAPLDREEVIRLIQAQDDIIDAFKDASRDLLNLGVSGDLHPDMALIARNITDATRELCKAVAALDVYNGEPGKAALIHASKKKVGELESEVDRVYREAHYRVLEPVRAIMGLKWDDPEGPDDTLSKRLATPGVRAMALRRAYDHFETIMDCCEEAADVLDAIALVRA